MCSVSFACVTMLVMSSLYVLAHMEYGPGFDNPGPTCFNLETAFIHADSWVSKFDPQEYDEDESSVGHFQSLISPTYDDSSSNTSWLNWLTWPIAEVLNVQNRRPATPIRDGRHILKGG